MSMLAVVLFFSVPYGVCQKPPTPLHEMSRKQQIKWINYYMNA